MESIPFVISMKMLDEVKSQFKSINQATKEAIRLAALNLLVDARYETDQKSRYTPAFQELSYGGELSGLDPKHVLEKARIAANAMDLKKWQGIVRGLEIRDFLDLLSYTHSISSFARPPGMVETKTRKSIINKKN